MLSLEDLKVFLDEKVIQYNQTHFIDSDPIQIPHRFTKKEDIEIAAFLSATIAWGNRKMIISNADRMMNFMGQAPYDFVMNHSHIDLEKYIHLFIAPLMGTVLWHL